jgi:hypothetical protein
VGEKKVVARCLVGDSQAKIKLTKGQPLLDGKIKIKRLIYLKLKNHGVSDNRGI